jgi:hypothetical protein
MRLPALRRSQRSLLSLLAVAALAATLFLYVTPSPQAYAESGRRICRYVWNQSLGRPDGRLVSLILDDKKDGACPYIDFHKVSIPKDFARWMPAPDLWENQPVPKMTCEQFQTVLDLPSGSDGGDPCTYLEDDQLYAVTSALPGDTAETKRFLGLEDSEALG